MPVITGGNEGDGGITFTGGPEANAPGTSTRFPEGVGGTGGGAGGSTFAGSAGSTVGARLVSLESDSGGGVSNMDADAVVGSGCSTCSVSVLGGAITGLLAGMTEGAGIGAFAFAP